MVGDRGVYLTCLLLFMYSLSLHYVFGLSPCALLRPEPNVSGRVVGPAGAQPEARVSALCSRLARLLSGEAEAGAGTPRVGTAFSRPIRLRTSHWVTRVMWGRALGCVNPTSCLPLAAEGGGRVYAT